MSRGLAQAQEEIAWLRRVVGTLIAWMAQRANSPISRTEAEHLIRMLENTPRDRTPE